MSERECFPATIPEQLRRPCRPRHPYAVPRTSLHCVCTRRRNCIAQLSPSREYALRTVDFPARNSATIELTTIHTAAVPDEESPSQTRPQRTQSEQMSFRVTPESRRRPMPEACLKRATSGCSRLAQSWSDLLSRADVFDGLSVILVRAMSGRPHSGNALPRRLRDRHQHTFV
jgi:hypothetical protein